MAVFFINFARLKISVGPCCFILDMYQYEKEWEKLPAHASSLSGRKWKVCQQAAEAHIGTCILQALSGFSSIIKLVVISLCNKPNISFRMTKITSEIRWTLFCLSWCGINVSSLRWRVSDQLLMLCNISICPGYTFYEGLKLANLQNQIKSVDYLFSSVPKSLRNFKGFCTPVSQNLASIGCLCCIHMHNVHVHYHIVYVLYMM